MKIDFLTHQQVGNPDGVQPTDWPADVIEVADNATPRPGAQLVTVAQFDAYKAARQSAYNSWFNSTLKPAMDAAANISRRAAAKDLLTDRGSLPKAMRGLARVINIELNKLRTAAGLPTRTMAEAVADWIAVIDSGSVD